MAEVRHSIRIAAQRAGLSPHVLRVWERRYGTVRPERGAGGRRRMYSDAEIERLALLREATEAGHAIGDIATLSTQELLALLKGDREAIQRHPPSPPFVPISQRSAMGGFHENPTSWVHTPPEPRRADYHLAEATEAVGKLDPAALETALEQALMDLGQIKLINQVIVPLVNAIGDAWQEGRLQVANEHIATAVLRTFLGRISRPVAVHPSAPTLLCATPTGQLHEIGAALAAATASSQGWRVLYAGPSLPASEIAAAARQGGVRAVALSVVYPPDDPNLGDKLRQLRRLLPSEITILVGGRAASAYRAALDEIGAVIVGNLTELADQLAQLRQSRN